MDSNSFAILFVFRFRQVILNLLSNAIKFTPPGGQVEVTLENNNPTCTSQVKVVVSDNGIGIATDKMGHLFSVRSAEERSLKII